MERGTCTQWLHYLDELNPDPDGWRDPEFVKAISWTMLMFLPRRMSQMLAEAADVPLISGTDLRDEQQQLPPDPGVSQDPLRGWH